MPPSPPPATYAILWGDWSRTQHRRAWLDRLHAQTVRVTLWPEPPPPVQPSSLPLTRQQRAHWRLSWSQPLARNAVPANQTHAHIPLLGIPPTISSGLILALA